MLSNLIQDIASCYQRAAECGERAGTCANLEMRQFYLEREKAWLTLARSYEVAERITRKQDRKLGIFKVKKVPDWPAIGRVRNCPSCKVETTVSCNDLVLCPNCGRVVDQVVDR